VIIKQFNGYELEKEKPNTSEDFFNRSSVTYVQNGEEHTFHVLYVRFFEENLVAANIIKNNPLFTVGEREISVMDIVALEALLQNPDNTNRKRIYINNENEFQTLISNIDFTRLETISKSVETTGEYQYS
jgi:hypothetical protein